MFITLTFAAQQIMVNIDQIICVMPSDTGSIIHTTRSGKGEFPAVIGVTETVAQVISIIELAREG